MYPDVINEVLQCLFKFKKGTVLQDKEGFETRTVIARTIDADTGQCCYILSNGRVQWMAASMVEINFQEKQ